MVVNLGTSCVSVNTSDDELAGALSECFRDLDGAGGRPARQFNVWRGDDGGLTLEEHGTILGSSDGIPTVLRVLQSRLNVLHIEQSGCPVTVHGAGVVLDGRALVVAAAAGGGKTSLVTDLLKPARGYLGDEAIGVSADGDQLCGFPKPLSIKPGHFDRRPGLVGRSSRGTGAAGPVSLVAASSIEPGVEPHWTARPGLVAVLRRIDGHGADRVPPTLRLLSPPEGVQRVAASVFGLEPSPTDAILALARLAARCPFVELTYSESDDAAGLVAETTAWPTVEPVDPPTRCEAPPSAGGSGPRPRPGVRAVELGGEVLFYEPTTRLLIRGSAVSGSIWRRADGSPPPELILAVMSDGWSPELAAQGLADLLSVGLLR
jgi:hypothetical protein